jgi:excisionase family DNA binding protein
MADELMTVEEVAGVLRVHARSVRRYIQSGALAAIRFGRGYRVRTTALEAFLVQSMVKPVDVVEEGQNGPSEAFGSRSVNDSLPPSSAGPTGAASSGASSSAQRKAQDKHKHKKKHKKGRRR